MSGASSKAKRGEGKPAAFVPHPDDATEARAAFEAVKQGDLLSPEESAAYLQALRGEPLRK